MKERARHALAGRMLRAACCSRFLVGYSPELAARMSADFF
jgi:hypothetical protein